MRVLLTNDDGIGASGLQALRRALLEIDGIELHVIAPDSNRSATARSITTRAPALGRARSSSSDGTVGYATDGTPVDCVRFAELGLIGERPELIVSGINHGSNLGDDVTYSGTVAAALEGIVLGIPAIAVSQQSVAGEMDFRLGREFDFSVSAPLAAALAAIVAAGGLPDGTLLNVNCPGDAAEGGRGRPARQAPLQRRAEAGRRRRRRAQALPDLRLLAGLRGRGGNRPAAVARRLRRDHARSTST